MFELEHGEPFHKPAVGTFTVGQLCFGGSPTCQQNDIKVWLFETNFIFFGPRAPRVYTPKARKIPSRAGHRSASALAVACQAGSHDASYVRPPILMDIGESRELVHPPAPKTSLDDPNFERSRFASTLATVLLFFIMWGKPPKI